MAHKGNIPLWPVYLLAWGRVTSHKGLVMICWHGIEVSPSWPNVDGTEIEHSFVASLIDGSGLNSFW